VLAGAGDGPRGRLSFLLRVRCVFVGGCWRGPGGQLPVGRGLGSFSRWRRGVGWGDGGEGV